MIILLSAFSLLESFVEELVIFFAAISGSEADCFCFRCAGRGGRAAARGRAEGRKRGRRADDRGGRRGAPGQAGAARGGGAGVRPVGGERRCCGLVFG